MSTVTSILGTDLISNAPSVLNGNFQNLNQDLITTSVLASIPLTTKIAVSSVAAAVLNITTLSTDRVQVWARGTISGSTSAGSVALLYNGVIKDSLEIKQAAAADQTVFSLMYAEVPGAGTQAIQTSVVANGALTIRYPNIMAQIITP